MNITTNGIKYLIYANVITMDKCLPGIMKIAHSDLSAEQVLESIKPEQVKQTSISPSV